MRGCKAIKGDNARVERRKRAWCAGIEPGNLHRMMEAGPHQNSDCAAALGPRQHVAVGVLLDPSSTSLHHLCVWCRGESRLCRGKRLAVGLRAGAGCVGGVSVRARQHGAGRNGHHDGRGRGPAVRMFAPSIAAIRPSRASAADRVGMGPDGLACARADRRERLVRVVCPSPALGHESQARRRAPNPSRGGIRWQPHHSTAGTLPPLLAALPAKPGRWTPRE